MNERIKELMDQARAPLHNKDLPFNQGLTEYSEKFAELIVKECAELMYGRDENGNCKDGDVIKQHFGVEK